MKSSRARGGSWLQRQVSPPVLFFIGLLMAPAVVLQDNLWIKLFQLILFIALSWYAQTRLILLGSLILFLATIFLNLLSPVGGVIARIGPFPLTGGALKLGLSKGLTISGLIYLSRFCIRDTLRLPGLPGRYLSKTLFYLHDLMEQKQIISRKDLLGSLDILLDKVYYSIEGKPLIHPAPSHWSGVLALLTLLLLNWMAVFFL